MGRKRSWIIILFFFLYCSAQAAPFSPADRDAVQQQQRDMLEQNRRQREALEQTISPSQSAAQPAGSASDACFPINKIDITGTTLVPESARLALIAPLLNQCVSISQIQQLVRQVSDWYLERGYITSRAYLTEQDLSSRQLILTVLEGRLERVLLENQPAISLNMAFPGLRNEVLNLRDIEQGMEQINRARRHPVQIDILPGSQPGYSIVNLTASPEFPLLSSLSFDNSGQKNTGVGQLHASLVGNNLLGLADRWGVSGWRSSAFANDRDAQGLQASLSLPYGYWLADYSYSWNSYLSTIIAQNYAWRYRGASENHRLTLSRVLRRNGQSKTAASLGISQRVTRNYLNDTRLVSSSRKLASVTLGVNHSQKLWGGYATLNPGVGRGVPWFGAENDAHKDARAPRAEFTRWTLSASYWLALPGKLAWLSSLYGQWTPDRLYGSERLTLGGETSVRGFKEQYISGDRGGFWRNELSRPLFTLPLLGEINALVAVDGGYLHRDKEDSRASGTLWGSAIGLSSSEAWFTSQVTVGWPLRSPGWLNADRFSVYYRASIVL